MLTAFRFMTHNFVKPNTACIIIIIFRLTLIFVRKHTCEILCINFICKTFAIPNINNKT